MSKALWLLRHGDAEDHGARSDFDRRLTGRGERQARAAGRALALLRVDFEQVFTSPRVRALATARLACAALGIEPVTHDPLAGEFEEGDAEQLLGAISPDGALLLVGHEPDMSGLVHSFTGARVAMKKGGLAQIKLGAGRGELAVLLRPGEIELLVGD
jgi:phosphohistidine phosphatase